MNTKSLPSGNLCSHTKSAKNEHFGCSVRVRGYNSNFPKKTRVPYMTLSQHARSKKNTNNNLHEKPHYRHRPVSFPLLQTLPQTVKSKFIIRSCLNYNIFNHAKNIFFMHLKIISLCTDSSRLAYCFWSHNIFDFAQKKHEKKKHEEMVSRGNICSM